MQRTRRMVRGAALAVGAVALLAACSSSGSDGAEVDAGGSAATGDGCDAISAVLLPPVQLSPEAGGEAREPLSDDEQVEALHTVASMVPEGERDAWETVVEALEQEEADPGSVDDETGDLVVETLTGSMAWAARTCPDAPPSWGCLTQAKFEQVGASIDAGGTAASPDGEATSPEEALAELDDADEAQELDRSDDAVLYGWLDEDGLVQNTAQVDRQGDGWTKTASRACNP